jgi:hypothetical protein
MDSEKHTECILGLAKIGSIVISIWEEKPESRECFDPLFVEAGILLKNIIMRDIEEDKKNTDKEKVN